MKIQTMEDAPRIWVGVHPSELDLTRLVRQHQDVHSIIHIVTKDEGDAENNRLTAEWSDRKGLLALYYFHDIIETKSFPLHGLRHFSAHEVPDWREWKHKVPMTEEYIADFTVMMGVSSWPPPWVTVKQRIADLKDLQSRWRADATHTELERCEKRYGSFYSGQIMGTRTHPNSVSEEEVSSYLKFRKERKNALGNK